MTFVWIGLLFVVLVILITLFAGHYAFSIDPQASSDTPASLSLDFEDIYYKNYQGDVLHGWWIRHPSAGPDNLIPTLIMVHGWKRNAERMLSFLEPIADLPLNFLLIEPRGHGENTKNNFITQAGFAHDLESALNWVVLQPGVQVEKIGVFGHSLGAAATIYTCSQDKRISFFVADSSFAHPREIIKKELERYHIPYFPFGWFMVQYIQIRLGISLHELAPENAMKNISRPGLLIHGDQDTVIPVEDCDRIARNAPGSVKQLIARGADHSSTPQHPEFRKVIRRFLKEQINPPDEIEPFTHRVDSSSPK